MFHGPTCTSATAVGRPLKSPRFVLETENEIDTALHSRNNMFFLSRRVTLHAIVSCRLTLVISVRIDPLLNSLDFISNKGF